MQLNIKECKFRICVGFILCIDSSVICFYSVFTTAGGVCISSSVLFQFLQRRIQNPAKHLRWSLFAKIRKKSSSQMLDWILVPLLPPPPPIPQDFNRCQHLTSGPHFVFYSNNNIPFTLWRYVFRNDKIKKALLQYKLSSASDWFTYPSRSNNWVSLDFHTYRILWYMTILIWRRYLVKGRFLSIPSH